MISLKVENSVSLREYPNVCKLALTLHFFDSSNLR